ncbi:MAG: hypothetical protein IJY39_05225 [Clostridia bacterium]|nr:hypothetical protein [Clostridia bacterium]
MKRFLLAVFMLALCLTALAGCKPEDAELFEFSYTLEKQAYARGEQIAITTTITNVSGKNYVYEGSETEFNAWLTLYCTVGGEKIVLEHEPVTMTDDLNKHIISNGQGSSLTFYYNVPKDALCGEYSLTLSYSGKSQEFPFALTVYDNTAQNEQERYSYSQTVIGSGEQGISPIECFSFEDYFDENGEVIMCADGYGVHWIFEFEENATPDDFPILVLDGEVKLLSVAENVGVSDGVSLYSLDFENLEYKGGLEGLSALPAGDYLVVIYESHETRLTNSPEKYASSTSGYECLFRLVVPVEKQKWLPEDITECPEGEECDRDSGCVSEGRLYCHGDRALLIDSQGSLIWLYSDIEGIFEPFDTGDYVRVGHGMVMESYPAQAYISQIALIENGDKSSLTDEEWERLEEVIVGLERE